MEILQSNFVAEVMKGIHFGEIARCSGISFDTRSIKAGDIFFAIETPNNDGHNYVSRAIELGASCVVFSRREVLTEGFRQTRVAFILVDDTINALQAFASAYRQLFSVMVIGITGSAGKTSTRDMLSLILSSQGPTIKNQKNYNNELGVPMTIVQLSKESSYAVIEMGMRGKGQIADLCSIAKPNIGIITNIGYSHIELLSNQDRIMEAKRELIDFLGQESLAILPQDDIYFGRLKENFNGTVLSFGTDLKSDIRYMVLEQNIDKTTGKFFLPDGSDFIVEFAVGGVQYLANAAAAVACGWFLNIPKKVLADALAKFTPEALRSEVSKLKNNNILINDTYNASPAAVKFALDSLKNSHTQNRMFIMGDMLELGKFSNSLHEDIGKYVLASNVNVLITVGPETLAVNNIVKVDGNIANEHFDTVEAAADYAINTIDQDWSILVKGSRSLGMEMVARKIQGEIGLE